MKERSKIDSELYLIDTPQIDKHKLIMVLSDIHYQGDINNKNLEDLVRYASILKPDYILIAGDIAESSSFLHRNASKEYFTSVFKRLSELDNTKTIMIPGNHDTGYGFVSGIKNRVLRIPYQEKESETVKYFESLSKLKNIYFLDNSSIEFENIKFLGFCPNTHSYLFNPNRFCKEKRKEFYDDLIEDYIKSNLKMEESKYNVLLTHSPVGITQEYVVNNVNDFKNFTDLSVTGHLHDGYIPKKLDRYFLDTNMGLFITPLIHPTRGTICRGMHEYGRGYLLVSQGFNKYYFNLGAADIEEISINSSNELKLTKKL